MGGDRDLALIGAGAGTALLILIIPLPFGLRALLALLAMGAFLIAAFLRVGPDRLPPEVFLWRRLRFRLTPRRRVYQRGAPEMRRPRTAEPSAPAPAAPATPPPRRAFPVPSLSLSVEAEEAAWAVRLGLGVAGAYFAWWLAVEGGAGAMARLLRLLLRI